MMSIYVEQQGSGPDLVLIHGWGLHGGIWGPWAEQCAERLRVTRVDLPGHGRSRELPARYDLDALADSVAAAVSGPAIFLGWSLGGLVALRLARRHPGRVRKLALVATSPRFARAPDWPHAMTAELLSGFAAELRRDYRETLNRFLALQVGFDAAGRALLRHLRAAMFEHGEPSAAALAGALEILRDTDLRAALAGIAAPTRIVHGERDRLAPPAAAERLAAALPSASLAVIPGAGHAPFLSHPEAFHDALDGFLYE
jgi:pimeloyl-[acyl-carrier protein] methyl ester esterase